jgi:thiol-disulfide isomerase/thioredoxin
MRDEACRALAPEPLAAALKVGQEAPDFELPDVTGKKWSLRSLRGRPVLLNFWATWCAALRRRSCPRSRPSSSTPATAWSCSP